MQDHKISNQTVRQSLTLAAIGCTGPIAETYVEQFLRMGITVRLLARDSQRASDRYPSAQVIKGSMMNVEDVARTIENADAVFLITPIGPRNDMSMEINAAKVTIEAAKRVKVPHLIFVSVIGIDQPTSVQLLDSKRKIEKMLAESSIPWTSIRCGSYMEDVIDSRVGLIKKRGFFVFPVARNYKFNFTCQQDVARLVRELLVKEVKLNRALDFIDPKMYTPKVMVGLMTRFTGRRVVSSGKWPLYLFLMLAWPILYWRKHRFSSIIPLIRYFNRHGYIGNTGQMKEVFPEFKITTLEDHLHSLLGENN